MAQRWFLAKNRHKLGPFTANQLQEMARAGQLVPTDMVLSEGDPRWVAASAVKGLFPPPAASECPTLLPRDPGTPVGVEESGASSSEETKGEGQQRGRAPELLNFLAPAQAPGEIGRLGPYRILQIVGSGGMGVV